MKHLLTAIACCLAVAGSAQTPYNPDGNADGMIGSADLVTLLSFYGALFESDSLSVVSVDELTELETFYWSDIDSTSVFLVPNDVDVVLNDPDSCYYYLLQLQSNAPRSVLVQSAGSPYVWGDSLITGGCSGSNPAAGVLNQFLRINGKVYPIW